jgi:ABC-type multidrug transport system fused ATPase/permease subunit
VRSGSRWPTTSAPTWAGRWSAAGGTSPAGNGNGSGWPGRCTPTRRCCSPSSRPRPWTRTLSLNALAGLAGLGGPWLLGRIVDAVTTRGAGAAAQVDRLAVALLLCALARTLLSRYALAAGYRFGERTAARIREGFLDRALGLPAAIVERVPPGDLAARGTTDVDAVAGTLRDALPDVFIAVVQIIFVVAAVIALDPLLGAVGVLGPSGIWFTTRWYLRRARDAYLEEGAANSVLAEELSATTAGARTVEAFGLQERRLVAGRAAIARTRRSRLRTLGLRSVYFPLVEGEYNVPIVLVLLLGGALYFRGVLTLGVVAASVLYVQQLIGPLDAVLIWIEQLQSSGASFARVEGLAAVPRAEPDATRLPDGDRIEVSGVRYAYDGGPDVLHGIDLTVRPGERLAVVGLSGAGKSTLGRLLAGVDRPRTGTVTVGGVPVAGLPPDLLRRQVVLVTQEHHVFLRDAAGEPDGPRTGRRAARGPRHGRRGLGRRPRRGPRRTGDRRRAGTAAGAGPGGAGRRAHGDPGRGDRAARPDDGPGRGARAGRGAARADRHRDRAPAADRARRGPGRCHGRGPPPGRRLTPA